MIFDKDIWRVCTYGLSTPADYRASSGPIVRGLENKSYEELQPFEEIQYHN